MTVHNGICLLKVVAVVIMARATVALTAMRRTRSTLRNPAIQHNVDVTDRISSSSPLVVVATTCVDRGKGNVSNNDVDGEDLPRLRFSP